VRIDVVTASSPPATGRFEERFIADIDYIRMISSLITMRKWNNLYVIQNDLSKLSSVHVLYNNLDVSTPKYQIAITPL